MRICRLRYLSSSSPCNLVRALRLGSRGGRASYSGGVTSAGWSSAGRWSGGRENGGRWRDRLSGVCLQLAVCCFCSCFDLLCVCICVCCDCYLLCICLKTGLGCKGRNKMPVGFTCICICLETGLDKKEGTKCLLDLYLCLLEGRLG